MNRIEKSGNDSDYNRDISRMTVSHKRRQLSIEAVVLFLGLVAFIGCMYLHNYPEALR